MNRILVPFDGSRPAIRAVLHVCKVKAFMPKVKLYVINIQPEPLLLSEYASPKMVAELRSSAAKKSESIFEKVRQKLDDEELEYQLIEAIGEPAQVVQEMVKRLDCDMVVMGTRGMGSIGNLILGSVAIKVVHYSPVPVLLVK